MPAVVTAASCAMSSMDWSRRCSKHVKRRDRARTSPKPTASVMRSPMPASSSRTPRPVRVGGSHDEGALMAGKPAGGGGKKGPQKGTGGHGRRKLSGKGPTPKAEERPGHPAYRRARSAAKRAATSRPDGPSQATDRRSGRGAPPPDEIVAGRNAVAEAMRAGVPAVAVYIAVGIERDERIDEIRKLAGNRQVSLLDVTRGELDRMAGTAPHQGVVLHARAFDYLHPDDLLRRAQEASEQPLLVAV